MGAGQFCTNPGIAVVLEGEHADRFTQSARAALERTGAQVMLTERIARAYREGQARLEARNAVAPVLSADLRAERTGKGEPCPGQERHDGDAGHPAAGDRACVGRERLECANGTGTGRCRRRRLPLSVRTGNSAAPSAGFPQARR